MTHAEKVAYFVADMRRRGWSSGLLTPPVFRLAWALGLKPPPPPFLSFWANCLWVGGLTALLVLAARAWVWWNHPDAVTAVGTGISLTLPVVFGAVFAALWRRQARRCRLPPWDDYPPPEQRGTAGDTPPAPAP